ncbi:MAG: hypothetical protein US35_C0017G0001, partial [Parcubacteria group bacterium GW2011_GWA2_37_10]
MSSLHSKLNKFKEFIASLFKNKKALIFVLLFLVFATVFFTGNVQTASAIFGLCDSSNLPNCLNSCTVFACRGATSVAECNQQCETRFGKSQVIISEPLPESRDSNKCHFDPIFGNGLDKGIGASIALLLLYSTWWIAYNIRDYFSFIFNWSNNLQITTDPIFIHAWASIRDIANMFIVLGFVIIGIATALRLNEYGAKKLLPKLIIIAVLINFSTIFSGLIIDAGNITMKSLTLQGSSSSPASKFIYSMEMLGQKTLTTDKCLYDTWNFTGRAVLYSGIYILIALIFFFLMFVLIERYTWLAFLFILSPLAFFAWIFPFTKKWWGAWWEAMLKWAFIGVTTAFVLYICASLIGTNNEIGITYIIIILVFLFVGFKFTIKSGGVFANTVIGLAGGVAGLAMGAAGKAGMGTLKGLANVSGAKRAGTAAKDWATQKLENLNLMNKGTTAGNKNARLKESRESLEKIQDNQALAKIAEQRAMTPKQQQDKAVAAEILAKRKAFNAIDPTKRDAVAAHAAAFGISKDTFTKESPETLATSTDQEAIEKVQRDVALRDRHLFASDKQAWEAAKKYKPSSVELHQAKTDLRQRKIMENALGIAPVSDKDVTNKLTEDAIKNEVASGKTYEEAAPHLLKNISERKKRT